VSKIEVRRKIIHVDMDAFFASVEQRDFPELRGKPVAVGGSSHRGVVAAASYEAREFGVRSAMPSVKARKLCPDLIFVKGRMEVYREISLQLKAIFQQFTDLIEPLSIDEAYLDVTVNKKSIPSAMKIALLIKEKIFQTTGLTASAGISFNKFLAKTASGMNKPDGFTVILPNEAKAFLESLPIEKFHGIGKVTAQKMHSAGIHKGYDLKLRPLSELTQRFGKSGRFFYNIVRANDDREVNPECIRKSISVERTFSEDLKTKEELASAIAALSEKLFTRVRKSQAFGNTLTLKIKYKDFTVLTRNATSPLPFDNLKQIQRYAESLMIHIDLENQYVRLLGIGISSLSAINSPAGNQLTINFSPDSKK
jgi:DNA polymerase IV